MNDTLRLRWSQAESGSEADRYACTFAARLRELGIHLAGAEASRELVPLDAPGALPPLLDLAAVRPGSDTALACRPDPARLTVIAFTDCLDAAEWRCLVAARVELDQLSPYPVRFVVLAPAAQLVAAPPAAAGEKLECHAVDAPQVSRILLAADVALVTASPTRQNQLLAAAVGLPTLLRLPDADSAPAAALAVADASPRQLAGLLLLLTVDPGIRRKVLDGQESLRRALTPDAQLQALAAWLIAQGVPLPPSPAAATTCVASGDAAAAWRVEGVFDSSYSLAIVNRHLALALADVGESVALYTYEQGEHPQPNWQAVEAPERLRAMWQLGNTACHPAVSLRNAWPPVVRDMRARRRVLASYAWEETAFPAAFAEEFNLSLDLITVVSRQTAQFLRDAGVSAPMAVVGNGVDHLLDVTPEPLPRALPAARFRFLHISSCFPRKGVDVLLKAYGEAFDNSDDVALVIKTFPNPHNDVAAQIERCRSANPRYPHIELIEEDWSAGQIASLYQNCHALVAPSRGEGFGLPIAEAILYRLPVIVTGWGGHRDFCTDDTAWLIDYTLQFANTHLSQTGSLWAEPDARHLTRLLQAMPALPEHERNLRAERARAQVLGHYTWQQVAARTRAAVAALDARPGLSPLPRIGWVSTWGSRCGVAAYSQHMVGAFAADELHIFAPAGEETAQADAANVHRNWTHAAANLDQLIADVRRLALDALVVQFHWGFFSLDALVQLMRAMRNAGVRVVIDFHNTRSAPPAAREAAVTQALASAERLLVHTLDDMQRLAACGLAANLTLFPLATYPIAQPDVASVAATRRRLGLERRRVIASYGFLLPHKGLAQLIAAMPALLAAQPDLHLLMVNALYSPERSDAEHRHLRERILDLGLDDRVTLLTDFLPEEECVTLLKTAELVVFPYQNTEESSSAAVRMALVAGCPVAVTPLPIFADVAPLVATLPGTDPASLAAGIADLLAAADPASQAAAAERTAALVADCSAERLSRRLRGLILGALASLDPASDTAC